MIVADYDWENTRRLNTESDDENVDKDNEHVDKVHFRREFFSEVLPTIAKHSLVKNCILLPFRPVIVLELIQNRTNLNKDYVIEFVKDDTFMKSSLEEFTKLGSEANINVDCCHGSNYPMTVTDLVETMSFLKCEGKKTHKGNWKNHLLDEFYCFESDNEDEPETYRWVKLTMKTLRAASDKDTSEEDCKAANQRVSKLLKVPKEDSVLTYDASVERRAGVRFNAKEHTVDIDLSEHSRLTEHVRQWIKLSKTEKKESLAIRLIDKDGGVVAFATDVEKNKKKRKKADKKRKKKKRKMDDSRGTADP